MTVKVLAFHWTSLDTTPWLLGGGGSPGSLHTLHWHLTRAFLVATHQEWKYPLLICVWYYSGVGGQAEWSPYSLQRVEGYGPHLAFSGMDRGGTRAISVIFGWSRTLIALKFSFLLCCIWLGPLGIERRLLFIFLFLVSTCWHILVAGFSSPSRLQVWD